MQRKYCVWRRTPTVTTTLEKQQSKVGLYLYQSILCTCHETGTAGNRDLYKARKRRGCHRLDEASILDSSSETVPFLLTMKLYVPNTQKWLDFFERVSTG